MKLAWALFVATALLAVLTAWVVEIRSNIDSVLVLDPARVNTLDSAAGRSFVVALVSRDPDARSAAARAIAGMLAEDPAVATVNAGPDAPSRAFVDWVWKHRFRLAPPDADTMSVEAFSRNLDQARAVLRSGEGIVVGDRLLRDPTGSFAETIRRFTAAASGLGQHDGVWQSRDDRAALAFITLADRTFDIDEIAALADRIRQRARTAGVRALLLGPQIISAEISSTTADEAMRAGLAATALLLVWLLWVVRSARALAIALLPLTCGFVVACLAVQLIFGSVHVIALGFGGVLVGLALDYSLHLLGQPESARATTSRLVLLGALTTAVGFLTMVGTGMQALMETGIFVAVGLTVAAVACRVVPTRAGAKLRVPRFERLAWHLPFRRGLEYALVAGGIAVLVLTPADAPQALFEPPERVQRTIAEFARMIELPSGRDAVLVEGATLPELLARERQLQKLLDKLVADGALGKYMMAARLLPETALSTDTTVDLPDVAEFRRRAAEALERNGMAPRFAKVQANEYSAALSAPATTIADLLAMPETRALADRLEQTSQGWRELVRVFEPESPEALAVAIAKRGIPGVTVIDLAAPFESAAAELRAQVLVWLGIGSLTAFAVLVAGHRDRRRALGIALTTGAATGFAAITLTAATGPPTIFELVALALVFGIGIDYGLFLQRENSEEMRKSDYRSVGLCATSTLVAFFCFALSSVTLLREIGFVVLLGVSAVLLLNTGGKRRAREE
jgi:predicted exporter